MDLRPWAYICAVTARLRTWGSRHLAVMLSIALVILFLVSAPPARAADTLTIDFETGPPIGTSINDDYLASHFTRFLAADIGFRPYRRSAPGQARSGSTVADVSAAVCFPDTGDAPGCEVVVPNMTGRLTRTASAVTVYAGLFEPSNGQVFARLTAYNANGSVVGTSAAVPLDSNGFTSPVTVISGASDIARFFLTVEGAGADNGTASLGFDDLTLQFPDNSLPDVSVSAPSTITTLRQGATTDVPIGVTRLNGSNGPVSLSVAGLPDGVSATFVPNPLPGTQDAAAMRLSVDPTAAEFAQPQELTITADPQNNGNVAPGPRQATTLVTLVTNFELTRVGSGTAVPTCASVDIGLRVRRSLAFTNNGTVTLSVETGPELQAQILPSPVVQPGGNLIAERTLRLRWTGAPRSSHPLVIRATSPGLPSRALNLIAVTDAPRAALVDQQGLTPRRGQPGSAITVEGNGFCPGTTVEVGNDLATASADVAADGRSLIFLIPRLGTDGPVTVVPPGGGARYRTSNSLKVSSFRNREGFAFDNYSYGWLSYGELTDLVGAEDLFIKINPCWPFATCTVVTGIPDPLAYIVWGILNLALHNSGGHCFAISRTLQELLAGKVPYRKFDATAKWPSELPSASGPNSDLSRWLDGRHAGQGTSEFLASWLVRDGSLSAQVDRVQSELQAGRYPGISLTSGLSGHVVTAYDMVGLADGSVKIYVYDNNRPFTANELSDKAAHEQAEVVNSLITISADGETWSFPIDGSDTWSGSGFSFYAVPLSAVPDDPSLPGIPSLDYFTFFGSPGAAATVSDVPDGAGYLPALDSNAVPGAAGTVVSKRSAGPVRIRVTGQKTGKYSQSTAGQGFVAAVRNLSTAPGVEDLMTTDPAAAKVTFAGERDRKLDLELGVRKGKVRRGANLSTKTFADGQEIVRFPGGRKLSYRHDGPGTTVSFTLIAAGKRGGQRFDSGPVQIPRDATLVAKPSSWRSLNQVRLLVKDADGKTTVRTLRNRARDATGLRLSKAKVDKRGRVWVKYRVVQPEQQMTLGVVVRVQRGGKVTRLVRGLADPDRRGVVKWRKRWTGRIAARADARLIIGGDKPSTVVTKSRTVLRVR